MDEPNIYGRTFYESRHINEESGKEIGESMEENDVETTDRRRKRDERRADRRRKRDERGAICRCRPRSRRRRQKILSQNPFIIFFLEMYYKTPEKHVTEVARQAGREWCALPEEQRKKYILLAERERRRRRRRGTTRRRRRRLVSET